MDWFTVDKEGLAALLERKGKAFSVLELVQNSWDAPGTTRVTVTLTPKSRGKALLVVEDDSPDGFKDLTHAFTLFAPSEKVHDETKRGRFNLGEKLVLAICDEATVTSTTGGYVFDRNGRRNISRHNTREAGSRFAATIRLTQEEQREVEAMFFQLIAPLGIHTSFNGQILRHRSPIRAFEVTLPTERADEDNILRPTRRKTIVEVYETQGDEVPSIYELGIPVVEWDSKFHVDIQQKVPLNFERDNVTPAYRRELLVAIVNETHDLLSANDAASTWVKEAASDHRTSDEAIRDITTKRYGDKAVAYDPSDPEANKEAVLKGYTVIPGGSLSREEWAQVRRAGVLTPAGQVTPSRKVLTSPDGTPPIDEEKWTPGMRRIADYAVLVGKHLLGKDIHVDFQRTSQYFAAAYGGSTLTFNLQRLGHAWFNEPNQIKVDSLLIHELAHDRVSDHLSEAFHDECCRLGARLRTCAYTLVES